MADTVKNPYVGPRTFNRDEADRFYGREQEANDLWALVVTERLALFYAQSGAGKSSLINTRLIPHLQETGFAVLPVGRVSGELPQGVAEVDNIFVFNLIYSLEQGDTDPAHFSQMTLSHFIAHLASEDGEHYYYDDSPVDDEPEAGEAEPRHVLIIDQFEEIVTHHLDHWPEREAFFRQLNQAMAADPLLWVVLTLREDYMAALEPYAPLMAEKMRARYYMQRMGTEAALQAVKRPAQDFGRPFAAGVAETLVDNLSQIRVHGQTETVSGQFVEPVQLQVVCFEMWANLAEQDASEITADDLQEAGDVDSALTDFYERAVVQALQQTSVPENELRDWFSQRLITEGGTRGTVYQGETETAGLPNAVAESLANQFLLRPEMRSGGIWYELVHDRFVEPIIKANQARQLERFRKEQEKRAKRARRYRRLAKVIGPILGAIFLLWLGCYLLVNSVFWKTQCLPDCPGVFLSRADLSGINLSEVDLTGAHLSQVNLSTADLSGANLSEADLSEANLSEANLSGASLSGADLSGADLSGVNLSEIDLSRANLSGANLNGADLSGANLNWADLSGANLDDSTQLDDKWRLVWEIVNQVANGRDLRAIDLSGANLSNTDLSGADLSGADLSGVYLINTDLSGVNLSEAYLNEASLYNANLSGADLSKTNLSGADLGFANLSLANLGLANLQGARLIRATLSNADLSGANLSGADLSGARLIPTDLSEANLIKANLSGAILIGVDLSGADLTGANLSEADLSSTRYSEDTKWPDGFDPEAAGAVLVE